MEKVQDIKKYGTAYVSVSDKTVGKILQEGLLGVPGPGHKNDAVFSEKVLGYNQATRKRAEIIKKEKWVEYVRETRESEVHFNIVGRSIHTGDIWNKVKKKYPGITKAYGTPIIIFDLDHFKEIDPIYYKYDDNEAREVFANRKSESHTYRIAAPKEMIDFTLDEKGNIGVSAEYGFSLSYHLRPDWFLGLAISESNKDETNELVREMKEAEVFTNICCKRQTIMAQADELRRRKKVCGRTR